MKKCLALFCILMFLVFFSPGILASTAWDPNMGGGGSGGGTGTDGNKWSSGWDGFRVTFISNNSSHAAATISVDLTNYDFSGNIVRNYQVNHSGKYKFFYSSGGNMSLNTAYYTYYNPSTPLPNVIGDLGDIDAVVARFSDAGTIKGIVQKFIYTQNTYGFSTWQELYNHLSDGSYSGSTFIPNYKILVEPIAYFYYDGDLYAMTAAEASRFQQQYGGLAEKMGSLTRYLLPTSMYLTASDTRIGLSAFSDMSSIISNSSYRFAVADILSYGVGCGIVTPNTSWNTDVDLTASGTASKSAYTSGETVTVNATVRNIGTRVAPPSYTSLKERYGQWDGSDNIQVQRKYTNALVSNGGSQNLTYTFTAPTVTETTLYYLAITADSYGDIAESNEGNNAGYMTVTVRPVDQSNLPDLAVTELTFNKSSYYSGETAQATMTVKNVGGGTATDFYNLLRDRVFQYPLYFSESRLQSSLSPGEAATYTFLVTMPTVTSTRQILFGAHADSSGVIAEITEDNNYLNQTVTVEPAPNYPDLIITSLSADKESYSSGETASICITGKNQGNSAAGAFYTRLSEANTLVMTRTLYKSSLAVGGEFSYTFLVSLPTVSQTTTLDLSAFIDNYDDIDELDETNNTKALSITVNPLPVDLTVTSLSVDHAVCSPGEKVTVTMTVKNQGTGLAENFYNRLYDLNGIIPKYINKEILRASLAGGASVTYLISFTAPAVTKATMIYLRGSADSTNVVKESDEDNNDLEETIIVMPNNADVEIDIEEGRYYTDTTVVTPAKVLSSLDVLPEDGGEVIFSFYDAEGDLYEETVLTDVICPEEDSQLVWSKWTTPSTPQEMTLTVKWTAKGGIVEKDIPIHIVELVEETPPDTTAKDEKPLGFSPILPEEEAKTSNSWSVWEYEGGAFAEAVYTATLDCTVEIAPAESVPTAVGDEMKSGYGIALTGNAEIDSTAPDSALAVTGNAVVLFPEFNYDTYYRVLDVETDTAVLSSELSFQVNPFDHYKGRTHFTPLWYPDGTYTVYVAYLSAYTPAGELTWYGSDDVTISGDLFDDWSVTPAKP